MKDQKQFNRKGRKERKGNSVGILRNSPLAWMHGSRY
jgi:hypothetical protein